MRSPSDCDRREVLVSLTPLGEELLSKLSVLHWDELQVTGPVLAKAIQGLANHSASGWSLA